MTDTHTLDPITFECPRCGHHQTASSSLRGRAVDCPGCDRTVRVAVVDTHVASADTPTPVLGTPRLREWE